MADRNHSFAIQMLHYYGFLTRSDPTIANVAFGRADICALQNGKAVNVEVKCGSVTFDLRNWRDNQRRWAEMSQAYPYNVPYYIFLTMGTHDADYNKEMYDPKRSWLIPSQYMLHIIEIITPIQNTLVYRIKKGINKRLQDNSYDAITLLKKYELIWAKRGSIQRPDWLIFNENTHNDDVSEESVTKPQKQKKYGGFWIVPENHTFALHGWTDIIKTKT